MNGEKQRQLTRAYQFNHETFVWNCSQCSRMFFLRIEEADSDNIPRHISHEFKAHACELPPALKYPSFEREDFDGLMLRLETDFNVNNRHVEHEQSKLIQEEK